MLITIAVFFFLLLALNFPIAVMLLAVAMISLYFYTDVSLVILIQTLFNGMDNYLLLSIPFFIIAGNIMARGAISRRIIRGDELICWPSSGRTGYLFCLRLCFLRGYFGIEHCHGFGHWDDHDSRAYKGRVSQEVFNRADYFGRFPWNSNPTQCSNGSLLRRHGGFSR